jgi:hypothetical protein
MRVPWSQRSSTIKPFRLPGSKEVQLGAWWRFNQSHTEAHPEATQDRIEATDYHLEEAKAHPGVVEAPSWNHGDMLWNRESLLTQSHPKHVHAHQRAMEAVILAQYEVLMHAHLGP